MDIRAYSTTAASNTADFPEGMAPGALNDENREVQAEIAQFVADGGGATTTAGSSTAYTITLNTTPTSLADGLDFWFTCDETNAGASTLVVTPNGASAFASKKIRCFASATEVDLAAGYMVANNRYHVQYEASADGGTGAFILTNPTYAGHVLIESGTVSAAAQKDIAMPTGYQKVIIELDGVVPATSAATLIMRVSIDNAVSYKSGASDYKYALTGYLEGGTANSAGSTAASGILVTGGLATTANLAAVSTIVVPNPASATVIKPIRVTTEYNTSSGAGWASLHGLGLYSAANTAITHIRLAMNTGNIASMNYRVIGVR